jgi:hypothetical protein
MISRNRLRVSGACLALWISLQAVHAATVVTPNSLAAAPGSSLSPAPYSSTSLTFQFQIAAEELTDAAGSFITGLSFRLNEGESPNTSQRTFDDYEITLAQAANPFGSISTVFANNMSDPVLVRDGPLIIPAGAISSGTNPNSFSYTLDIDNYTYTGGDLVGHITYLGNGLAPYLVDAAGTLTGGYGNTPGARFYAQGTTGFQQTTASPNIDFPVVQLTWTPVPEPSEYAMIAGIGLVGFALLRLRLRRSLEGQGQA